MALEPLDGVAPVRAAPTGAAPAGGVAEEGVLAGAAVGVGVLAAAGDDEAGAGAETEGVAGTTRAEDAVGGGAGDALGVPTAVGAGGVADGAALGVFGAERDVADALAGGDTPGAAWLEAAAGPAGLPSAGFASAALVALSGLPVVPGSATV